MQWPRKSHSRAPNMGHNTWSVTLRSRESVVLRSIT